MGLESWCEGDTGGFSAPEPTKKIILGSVYWNNAD
jgi:hypothetical protein